MKEQTDTLLKRQRHLALVLTVIGALFILVGALFDFSWLKTIGDTLSGDGDCDICKIGELLQLSWLVFALAGAILIGFAARYSKEQVGGRTKLELVLLAMIFLIGFFQLISSQIKQVSNDEYEHLHNAWLMLEGTIPFFSITSTHTPLLEWIILAFMRITGESVGIIQVMRIFVLLLSCVSLWMVYLVTKRLLRSRIDALIAVLLLMSNKVWITRSLEIIPDNVMLFFVLVSFISLLHFYGKKNYAYLALFGLCSALSLLGKQNAAVFLFALGTIFVYHIIFSTGENRKRRIAAATAVIIIMLITIALVGPARDFLVINTTRHLVPNDLKFWPYEGLTHAWMFNPAVFVLFVFQIFHTKKLSAEFEAFKSYLIGVPLVCLLFLFIMNRPFNQEFLVMVIFMSIVGSSFLGMALKKLEHRFAYLLVGTIALPALIYVPHVSLTRSAVRDIEMTKTILRISEPDDLVFDAYGMAIFRHSPLEPRYLVYFPERFPRFDVLKSSAVQYVINDGFYYPRLGVEVHDWVNENFVQTFENPDIYVRVGKPGKSSKSRSRDAAHPLIPFLVSLSSR